MSSQLTESVGEVTGEVENGMHQVLIVCEFASDVGGHVLMLWRYERDAEARLERQQAPAGAAAQHCRQGTVLCVHFGVTVRQLTGVLNDLAGGGSELERVHAEGAVGIREEL